MVANFFVEKIVVTGGERRELGYEHKKSHIDVARNIKDTR